MQRDPRAFLWDVREAAQAIQSFSAGLDVKGYVGNELVQAAVERKFEVIGEALNQLAKLDAAMAARIPDVPQVVAFRNQLIMGTRRSTRTRSGTSRRTRCRGCWRLCKACWTTWGREPERIPDRLA